MRDYRLYQFYVLEYGLTFVPKGLDGTAWEAATELMVRALSKEGPIVTHGLIISRLAQTVSQTGMVSEEAA